MTIVNQRTTSAASLLRVNGCGCTALPFRSVNTSDITQAVDHRNAPKAQQVALAGFAPASGSICRGPATTRSVGSRMRTGTPKFTINGPSIPATRRTPYRVPSPWQIRHQGKPDSPHPAVLKKRRLPTHSRVLPGAQETLSSREPRRDDGPEGGLHPRSSVSGYGNVLGAGATVTYANTGSGDTSSSYRARVWLQSQ